jgi:hypothetical protein
MKEPIVYDCYLFKWWKNEGPVLSYSVLFFPGTLQAFSVMILLSLRWKWMRAFLKRVNKPTDLFLKPVLWLGPALIYYGKLPTGKE